MNQKDSFISIMKKGRKIIGLIRHSPLIKPKPKKKDKKKGWVELPEWAKKINEENEV